MQQEKLRWVGQSRMTRGLKKQVSCFVVASPSAPGKTFCGTSLSLFPLLRRTNRFRVVTKPVDYSGSSLNRRWLWFRSIRDAFMALREKSVEGGQSVAAGVRQTLSAFDERFSVAPMLDVTNNHFRHLCRLISKRAVLYTEMVVDNTLIHNPHNLERFLHYNRTPDQHSQHPVVLQLGGSDPDKLAAAAQLAAPFGYDAVNLNCGCPSPKVAGKGCFGASLMLDASNVAEACRKIGESLGGRVPVSVKCRIGVDRIDNYAFVRNFVQTVVEEGGVQQFAIHARAAWLDGLSPAQNRSVPPLRYEYVSRLAEDFPECRFVLNGGVRTLDQAKSLLHEHTGLHGVMLGRAVRDDPWGTLAGVDSDIYGEVDVECTRDQVVRAYAEYAGAYMDADPTYSPHHLVSPVVDVFYGAPNGRLFRRAIDDGNKAKLDIRQTLLRALEHVPPEVRHATRAQVADAKRMAQAAREQAKLARLKGVASTSGSDQTGTETTAAV
mmetsp:Transcript_17063/g.37112  ORF Transcript_17063/g.37112 Transcript_17063/m.37112 type:complete len:493 (-) Transcript_17063:102-1580(-)